MSRQFNRPVEFDPALYQSVNKSVNQSGNQYVSQHQYLSREQVLKNEFGLENEEEVKESINQSVNQSKNNQFDSTGEYSDLGFNNSEEISSINQSDDEIDRLTEQCSVYQKAAFQAESTVARLQSTIQSINQSNKQARTLLIKQFKEQINQLIAEIEEQKQMLSDDDETINQLRSAIARFDNGEDEIGQSINQSIDPVKIDTCTRAQQREILELKAEIRRLQSTNQSTNQSSDQLVNQSTNQSETSSPAQSKTQAIEPQSINQSTTQSNNPLQAEQIAKLESINQSINQSLEKAQHDLQAANQSIKQLNQSINQLKKELSSKDQSINQLTQAMKQLELSNKQLEITSQVSNLSINQLTEETKRQSISQSPNQTINQSISQSNDQEVQQLKQSINQLSLSLDSKTKEVEICKQSINQLQQSINQSINQSTNQTQELTQKLLSEQLLNQSIKQSHDESLIQIQSLNETINQLQQSINQSNNQSINQSEVATQRERTLETQLSAYKLQIESLNRSITQSNQSINQSIESYQLEVQTIKDKAKEKLAQASQKMAQLKTEYQSLRSSYQTQKLAHQQSINQITNQSINQCVTLKSQISLLKQSHSELRVYTESINQSLISSFQPMLTRRITAFTEGLSTAYRSEVAARKKLFNQLQELKGNIRVYCRVRPQTIRPNQSTNPSINQSFNQSSVTFKSPIENQPNYSELTIYNNEKKTSFDFEFDCIFDEKSRQSDVFDEVSTLISSVLDGYNVCIFAYGQTGAGKSYTMQGPESDPGVNTRALETLFSLIDQRNSEWSYSITISLMEIYNEKIHDLLSSGGVNVCKATCTSNGMIVQDLTLVDVESSNQVLQVLHRGSKNRKVSATAMNADSSRSHLILSVYTCGKSRYGGKSTIGKMHLIDLAGSERITRSGVTGDALKEAQAINLSLSALGNVISARANKAQHVPYRDSTLTYLLQDSLEKNSKTLMFVQVSPDMNDAAESICSLRFAERVRKVELGKAAVNVGKK